MGKQTDRELLEEVTHQWESADGAHYLVPTELIDRIRQKLKATDPSCFTGENWSEWQPHTGNEYPGQDIEQDKVQLLLVDQGCSQTFVAHEVEWRNGLRRRNGFPVITHYRVLNV